MGKKKQGKGKVVVESTNLEQFIATEEKKEREKESLKSGKPPVEQVAVNPCKQRLEQMLKAYSAAKREETKQPLFSETINTFGYLDNKLIEAYAYNLSHFSKEENAEIMEQP
jgi:hypothetical protein